MENLYTNKALNYYNESRKAIITDPFFTYEDIADRLKDLHQTIEELGIKEGNEHYDDCQDLLNTIEVNLDFAVHSF